MAKEKAGSVHQRNKKFVARISFIGNDGKRKFRKQTFDTQKEARAGLKAMLHKLETKEDEDQEPETKETALVPQQNGIDRTPPKKYDSY
jgi:hypothetical protein